MHAATPAEVCVTDTNRGRGGLTNRSRNNFPANEPFLQVFHNALVFATIRTATHCKMPAESR